MTSTTSWSSAASSKAANPFASTSDLIRRSHDTLGHESSAKRNSASASDGLDVVGSAHPPGLGSCALVQDRVDAVEGGVIEVGADVELPARVGERGEGFDDER